MKKCNYTGEVNDQNRSHGQGTYVGKDHRCVGTFKDDSLVKGKLFDESAAGALRYEGEFSGAQTGTLFREDGEVMTGRWGRNRLIDGTVTHPDGTVIKHVNGKVV